MIQALPSANNVTRLNGPDWRQMGFHIYPILGVMVVTEQAVIQMMKEYFEIERPNQHHNMDSEKD